MATTPAAKTPSIALARALRRLGLTQGKGKDFRVDGDYNKAGERVRTYALLLTAHADETVAARADDIERWISEDGGWSFTVNVRYSDTGRPHCTISNGAVEKVREEPPAPPATEAAPEPQPEPEQAEEPTAGTAVLEDPAQPEGAEEPPAEEPPASKGSLTITHTRAEGTLLEGSRKGDGVYEIVRPIGFRSSRSLGALYIQRSRDREADRWRINRAAAALREAGWEVTVEIDETKKRSFQEAEDERLERAEDRTERFSNRAGRAASNRDARHKAARGALDGIEPGQPILVGHHSERAHRRAIDRSDNHMRAAIKEDRKAEHYTHRAEAAEKYEERRYDPNRTRRRLEKLNAELRGLERRRDEGKATDRDARRIDDLNEEIAHWEKVVEKARQEGKKLWEADDFATGDFALYSGTWYQIKRVNPKTLSIAWNLRLTKTVMTLEDATEGGSTWTFGMDYTKIRARCPEAAMMAFLADGKVPGTKSAWAAHEAQPASEVRAAQAAAPKKKKRSDPKVPKKVKVECGWDATEAKLIWLDGKGEPHKLREPVTIQAPEGTKFTESVWSRSLLAEVTRLLTAAGFQYRGSRWSGSPGRGIVHAIEPTETTEAAPVEAGPDQAPPVEPPAEEPPAAEPEQPVDEPPAPEPAEDPQDLRLQREQAAALGWSAGQAEFVIAAAAGRLYLHKLGSLYCRDIPGTVGRLVSNHRLSALQKAGFVTVGAADSNQERPVLVTVDGRRAVAVWKRWKPRPVKKNREEECERLRPLLHGVQARRLAEQAAEDEAKRKANSAAFREAHQRLMEWEDREDRLWAAWAKVQGIVYRLQRRQAGWVPTEEEIEAHCLDPEVVAELREDAVNPQPRPVLPDLKQKPMAELPPLEADDQTPEQLDLFAVA